MSKLFGIRLKNLREKKNISQAKLADMLGVSQRIISNWEKNEAEPSTYRVAKIAMIFNVQMPFLYGWDNQTVNELKNLLLSSNDTQFATPDILEIENIEVAKSSEYERICNIDYSENTYSSKLIMNPNDNLINSD